MSHDLNERMTVERRQAWFRRERADIKGRECHETKLNTEIDESCCERPEKPRCAAPRSREGQQ
eukprot:967690-Pleurochrysis_carterae.AAC.1